MAIKDLLNNYYYGKQGKRDFTVDDMPGTRRELFGAVLKVRWSSMVVVNLMYLVIWLPAIIWTFMNVAALNGILAQGETLASSQEAASLIMVWLIGMFPAVAITGPVNAGVTYVLRNWARDEHSFIWLDFKDAVKANWRQSLAVSTISGLVPVVLYTAVRFYSGLLKASPVFIVPVALVMMVGLLWSLSEMLMYPMLVTYSLKLKDVVRNSLLMTVGKLPHAVLFKLITLVLPVIAAVAAVAFPGASFYVLMAMVVLYGFFMLAFNKLVTVSYANWLCERYLNANIEGARTDIGLRPKRREDGEDAPND